MWKSRVYASTAVLKAGQSENRSEYEGNIKSRKQSNNTGNNQFRKNLEKTRSDPHEGCCWQGETFINALKAMITRLIFLLHSMVVVWRVTEVAGDLFWLFAIPYLALIIEAMIVLLFRRAKEWKW